MLVKLNECGIGGGPYRGGAVRESWYPGQVRDVSDELAAYLLRDFPGVFAAVVVDAPVMAATVPALDRKVRSTRKR